MTVNRSAASFLILLIAFVGVALSSVSATAGEWQLIEEKHHIKLYLRNYPDSDIPEFKAVTTFNTDMNAIMAVLVDVPGFTRWIYHCSKASLLQTLSDNDYVIYQVNALPFVNDRDVIMRVHIERSSKGNEITIDLQADADFCNGRTDPQCQTTRNKKYVRIVDSVGQYQLRAIDDNHVELTWQQHIDPAGKLPVWLIKRTLSNLPIESLTALRQLVEK